MIWRVVYRTANENHNQKRPDIIMIFMQQQKYVRQFQQAHH